MSLAVAQQTGGSGSGVNWVSVDDTPIGILGPDGETVYALFVRQPDGSVQMQITPRTGTLAALGGIAGANGEVATSPSEAAIILLSGQIGESKTFRPVNFAKLVRPTAHTSGVATLSGADIAANAEVYLYQVGPGVMSVSNLGQLTSGSFPGQRAYLVNGTGLGTISFAADGDTGGADARSVPDGSFVVYEWNGADWKPLGVRTPGSRDESYNPTARPGAGVSSFILGDETSTANGDFAVCIGSESTADGDLALALGPQSHADKAGSIATQGTAPFGRSFNEFVNSELTTYKCNAGRMLLGRRISAAGGELTTLGTSTAVAENFIDCRQFVGCLRMTLEFFCWQEGTNNYALMSREVILRSDGSTGAILTQTTIGTDSQSGLSGIPTVTLSIDATTTNHLKVLVGGLASTILNVTCTIRYQGAMQ